ncbi:MAG: MMPL family transporter [Solirubrobacteraceae bacterium]
MGPLMNRLSTLARRQPRRVLLGAALLFVVAAVFGAPVTGLLGSSPKDFQSPISQYERANAEIGAAIHQNPVDEVMVLVSAGRPIASNADASRAVTTLTGLLAEQPGFQRQLSYPATHSAALLSRGGDQTVVLAAFATASDGTKAISRLRARLSRLPLSERLAGIHVRFGGLAVINQELNERTTQDLERAELLGLPVLLLLSFWFFRGLVAALLPLLVGGLSILLTFLGLRVVDELTPMSVFALNLVSGMGLGLGIDYSLFVLYRYREELAVGASPGLAIERTLRTAGGAVLFSCLTVAAAMTTLLVFPLRFLYSMGVGGALVTLCSGGVALLVLPALLMVLGHRINALSPRSLQWHAQDGARTAEGGRWWRLATGVVRRPVMTAVVVVCVLVAAAIPAAGVRFTSPAAQLLPPSAESYEAEAALARDFPANAGEATEIILKGPRSAAMSLGTKAAHVAGGLASGAPPSYLGKGVWQLNLYPRGSPYSKPQQRLLSRLRTLARPRGALVGGTAAFFADQKAAIASRIPIALLILLPLTACFLFAMTGSVTIPVKALLMNALSVGVAVGLQVLIFQDGYLSSLLGFKTIGGLEESSLVLMVVLTFALATDYEVFVLARVKEAHDAGLENRAAIVLGVERTGRIVTAAALLFCVAMGALVTSELFFTKQIGLGAALAVAFDATLVRALLVPALMALMGDWNWWAPAALRRLHRRVGSPEKRLSAQYPVR